MRILRLNFLAIFISVSMIAFCGSYFFHLPGFRIEDVTSKEPYRLEWDFDEPSSIEQTAIENILKQSFSLLGEGGQSYAFESSDGRYVLKLFKFRRFRPASFIHILPDIGPFSSFRHRHITKRHQKLETAFEGYRIAYHLNKRDSGLIFLQFNSLSKSLPVKLIDANGRFISADLQHVPFVLQLKGDTLGQILKKLLIKGDVDAVKECLTQLFILYRSEYAKGLRDSDRGILHNIGVLGNAQLFHLDVGKLTYRPEMRSPEKQQGEFVQITLKIKRWLQLHFPDSLDSLEKHLSNLQEALLCHER